MEEEKRRQEAHQREHEAWERWQFAGAEISAQEREELRQQYELAREKYQTLRGE
jgi:hypothetical protein